MQASTVRTQAKELLDFIPDDKITLVFSYIQSFTDTVSSTSINYEKKAAYEALLADVKPIKSKALSLNGQEEVANIIQKKYESLN